MTARYPREFYMKMVEDNYFGNVDGEKLPEVVDCFCEDIIFTIQSSFTVHEGRDTGIKTMFETLFENYKHIRHGDFSHVVDVDHQCIASRFNVHLIDNDGEEQHKSNCNFFFLENGKFRRVFVYMSGENVLV